MTILGPSLKIQLKDEENETSGIPTVPDPRDYSRLGGGGESCTPNPRSAVLAKEKTCEDTTSYSVWSDSPWS